MRELIFRVDQEPDGGYVATAIGEGVFTQGDTWDELLYMVADATEGYFGDDELPSRIKLLKPQAA